MSSKHRNRRQQKSVRPRLEELEARIVPATFDVNTIGGLLSAIQSADSNSDAGNTIVLAQGTYTLQGNTTNEIQIQNQTATNKTLTIEGNTEQNTVLTGGTGWNDRIFEMMGGNNLTVMVQNLTITAGRDFRTITPVVGQSECISNEMSGHSIRGNCFGEPPQLPGHTPLREKVRRIPPAVNSPAGRYAGARRPLVGAWSLALAALCAGIHAAGAAGRRRHGRGLESAARRTEPSGRPQTPSLR